MLQPILHTLNAQRVVLASSSPRRKQLLTSVGMKFDVVHPTFEENLDKAKFSGALEYVLETSRQKTLQASEDLMQQTPFPDLVIGADTVVSMDGKIFEKPQNQQDAFNMLSGFSGRSHMVYTAVVLVFPNRTVDGGDDSMDSKMLQFHEATEVVMAKLTPAVIDGYVATGEPMDKAGGYGIQGIGCTLVEKINGDFYNVMGLPICRLAKELLKIYSQQQ